MTPNQEAQKKRAMDEAMKHMEYSAVDRMRDKQLENYEREDAITNRDEASHHVRDVNGASGDDK